jgi:hypothetical protein
MTLATIAVPARIWSSSGSSARVEAPQELIARSYQALVDPQTYVASPNASVEERLAAISSQWQDERQAWLLARQLLSLAWEEQERAKHLDGSSAASTARARSSVVYTLILSFYDKLRVRTHQSRVARKHATAA